MAQKVAAQPAKFRQLEQIIAGLGEGVILVDPDQQIVWANNAALKMHGITALPDLGADISEYRKRFILKYRNNHSLELGDYPIERVVAGEAFEDVIVEVTSAADPELQWVHRVRSLVLTDENDHPDCLVLIIQDASDHFEAEERFEKTFNANPAPAVIARLSDLRYVKVNQGFLEMTGYDRHQIIGRSVYEVDVLQNADKKEIGIERLQEGRTIPQMEAHLNLPSGGTKAVVVAGQPIEISDHGCMLFTFMDMEPRKKAEDALRQSEERFAKSFRLAPVPTFICHAKTGLILDVNDAFASATGFQRIHAVGSSAVELELWNELEAAARLEEHMAKTGGMRNIEIQVRTKAGVKLDCLVSSETVTISGEPCILSVLQDITERRQSEMELFEAIEAVMQDATWFSRTIIEKIAAMRQPYGTNKPASVLADLSFRETQILTLICEGLADKQIATQLKLAPNTVRNHVATVYRKINVHRRGEAVVWGRERGLCQTNKEKSVTKGKGKVQMR